MAPPLLLQFTLPDPPVLESWASGPGLPTVVACSLLLLLTLFSLVRIYSRRRQAADFEEADEAFLGTFRNSSHVLAIFQDNVEFQSSPHWQVYLAGCRELAFHLVGTDRVEKNFAARLSTAGRISISQLHAVQRAMKRAADEIELDFQRVTSPDSKDESFIRWTGLVLGMAIFANTVLCQAVAFDDISRLIFPSLLPAALSILLSQVISVSASSLTRRTTLATAKLHLYPAELSIMIERTFVDHGAHPVELPSVAGLGAPVASSFHVPPSDSITRLGP